MVGVQRRLLGAGGVLHAAPQAKMHLNTRLLNLALAGITLSSRHALSHPQEFELTLNVEKFIAEVDKDASGWIEFDEFKNLLL